MKIGRKAWNGLESIVNNTKKSLIPLAAAGFMTLSACDKEPETTPPAGHDNGGGNGTEEVDTNEVRERTFTGNVQKGPFVGGTVQIYNLPDSSNLRYNGDFHEVNINGGTFGIVPQTPPYVRVEASGDYFNEVSGETSTDFSMKSVTKSTDTTVQSSVNTIGDVTFSRIANLVSSNTFEESRKQAVTELLSEFQIDTTGLNTFNYAQYDLTQQGHQNASLLAISSITQGHRNPNELSNFLNDIENDLADDGSFSQDLGDRLRTSALYLRKPNTNDSGYNYDYIAQNLTDQNSNWNIDTSYKGMIENFIQNSPYGFNEEELYKDEDMIDREGMGTDYHNLIKPMIQGNDTLKTGGVIHIALDAKVPAGEKLNLEVMSTTPSNANVELDPIPGRKGKWEEQGGKYVAIPKPYSEGYSKSRIYSDADHVEFKLNFSESNTSYTTVVKF